MASFIRNDKIGTNVYITTWTGLSENDREGDFESLVGAADKTVQVTGTFGGAMVVIEGSNVVNPSASDWFILTTASGPLSGTNLTFSGAGGALVAENPLHIRPRVTGGTSTDLTVDLVSRNSR